MYVHRDAVSIDTRWIDRQIDDTPESNELVPIPIFCDCLTTVLFMRDNDAGSEHYACAITQIHMIRSTSLSSHQTMFSG